MSTSGSGDSQLLTPVPRCGVYRRPLLFEALLLILLLASLRLGAGSYYTQRLEDPGAVYVAGPSGGDDTGLLQQGIDRVQQTTGQGIVLVGPGDYRVTDTVHIWPGIRLIGWGARRPVVRLPANTPGFQEAAREKVMFFFAGGRPGFGRGRASSAGAGRSAIPDANPGTFYSALANIDIEIGEANAGAVVVRSRYAQHCFLAHMDFRLGSALAGVHEAGNVIEDARFVGGRYGIWTSKPSPGWQLTVIDCVFEGQREAAILEREAGLTLIRPRFLRVPTAVAIERGMADELWIKDGRFEEIAGPALLFGLEQNPRNEINCEGIACRDVPVFAALRESGRRFRGKGKTYKVKIFSHGLHYAGIGEDAKITTEFESAPLRQWPTPVSSDLPDLPARDSWMNVRDLGIRGDGTNDNTELLQAAIANHRALYFPSGFYVVRDTLKLRPDTVLIGLHPGATQLIVPDETPGFQGQGEPRALIEAPKGGSNIVIGIGLYTSGANPRAVAALWKAGANSMMNDVRFLGGHGTPRPDGSRERPYNSDHTADPDPRRIWDSQLPSLWVTDGGGGTFLDIWTPSTFAKAGMLVSDTATEGRVYQMSSEHHVHNEVQVRNAAHWSFYALQTEAERGESGQDLPLEFEDCHDITVANLHIYRVISMYQPFPYAVKVSRSRDIRFRNLHCYSNSKVSYDASVYDDTHRFELRQREFAWLNLSGEPPRAKAPGRSPVLAPAAAVQKVAGGFYNISGGAAGPRGEFYFVDAHPQRVYCWDSAVGKVTSLSNSPPEPVNLAVDRSGNLVVVSYAGAGSVYRWDGRGSCAGLPPQPVAARPDRTFYLPVSDWRVDRESLSHPAAHYVSPNGTTIIVAGADFLSGAMSWGVKSSPPIRSFGLAPVAAGQTFYVTDESELTTWAASVSNEGALTNFRLFAEQGGEGVAVDEKGNVYIAAGEVYVYSPAAKLIDMIRVPERPVQVVFGGPEGRTLFMPARTSLYCVRTRYAGR